ncbi:hypothetical protein BML2526_10290 [Providencia rettgeri]|nr:hypothetical protein BML2526_10290 [Providencia rettgeri]BBV14347.1 hypothetical protein BML2576_38060 [Providencia rettgeri]BDH20534.1 hypothetical protein PrNR1418_38250 [Providencia rettgeri]
MIPSCNIICNTTICGSSPLIVTLEKPVPSNSSKKLRDKKISSPALMKLIFVKPLASFSINPNITGESMMDKNNNGRIE